MDLNDVRRNRVILLYLWNLHTKMHRRIEFWPAARCSPPGNWPALT